MPSREVDHGTRKRRLPDGAPVQIIDPAIEGRFDRFRRRVEGRADPQPPRLQARLANLYSVEKIIDTTLSIRVSKKDLRKIRPFNVWESQ